MHDIFEKDRHIKTKNKKARKERKCKRRESITVHRLRRLSRDKRNITDHIPNLIH